MEIVGACFWMDNHAQLCLYWHFHCHPQNGSQFTVSLMNSTALLAKMGISSWSILWNVLCPLPLSCLLLLILLQQVVSNAGLVRAGMWLTKLQPDRRAGQTHGQEPPPATSEQQPCMWSCLDHKNISGLCKVPFSLGEAREGGMANTACRGWPARSAVWTLLAIFSFIWGSFVPY